MRLPRKLILCYAFLYSFCFILIPWESMFPLGYFIDKSVYLKRMLAFSEGRELYVFDNITLTSWVTNELGWAYLLLFFSNLNFNHEWFLKSISFFIVFVNLFFVVTRINKFNVFILFIISLLFINPIFVDFSMSQIRSAFCLSIFLVFLMLYESNKKTISLFFLSVVPIIHTIGIVLISFYFLYLLLKRFSLNMLQGQYFPVVLGLLFSLFMFVGWHYVLSYLGDRRAEYSDMSSSLKYMIFWVFLLFAFVLLKIKCVESYIFLGMLLLSIAVFNTIFSLYSSRFIALGFVFIIPIFFMIRKPMYFYTIVLAYMSFTLVQWFFWFELQELI